MSPPPFADPPLPPPQRVLSETLYSTSSPSHLSKFQSASPNSDSQNWNLHSNVGNWQKMMLES
ncbi:hypothetical protein BVRB_4g085050 [Beta vulgaris subsp. vulgaris]|nr:hypothetical protein BVRB_4g085050 [Beta vulgaris subsp. vulgaris]